MTKKAESTRCVTGIEGLDRIIGGGLPVGGTILVAGICGSGKSALLRCLVGLYGREPGPVWYGDQP